MSLDQLAQCEVGTLSPKAVMVDLLCRLYRTDAQGLGLAGDYRQSHLPQVSHLAPAAEWAYAAPAPDQLPVPARQDESPFDQLMESARRSVDRTLASATVSAAQLDLLDERILGLRQQYFYTPPRPMLTMLLTDLREVRELAAERQPAAAQVRLSEMTALLATLVADALMKLGTLRHARAWYATARLAADDSGNVELRARVRAQAAMLPYYYGPLETAVALAREARLLLHNRPCASGAFAAAAEARALARLGDAAGAESAIRAALTVFEKTDNGPDDDAFAFPQRRLLMYLSGAFTSLGRSRKAREARKQALSLYPGRTGIDPALLRLEEAICLAQDRSPSEACQLAEAVYLQVPEPHRTPILGARARHVIDVLPPAMRSGRAARNLNDLLALTPGTM
ncbi:XRE family transcriptional regulator [Streptomyces sp. LX-29]|uniref:XRE family transcriptional regulator n=1 Tax=Streptomyces sp. LX-29 TaxID=2900152 RepID=UPI00240D0BB8|nr:XRE family transcriptional regulator [Streptomyces sp. LX-29]WFB07905.1 XRE family transcriptional regulator [Streptomyces sp. LX-29]